jgi:hypothetical protein
MQTQGSGLSTLANAGSAARDAALSVVRNAQSEEEMDKQLAAMLSIVGKLMYPHERVQLEELVSNRRLDFARTRELGARVVNDKFAAFREEARQQQKVA